MIRRVITDDRMRGSPPDHPRSRPAAWSRAITRGRCGGWSPWPRRKPAGIKREHSPGKRRGLAGIKREHSPGNDPPSPGLPARREGWCWTLAAYRV